MPDTLEGHVELPDIPNEAPRQFAAEAPRVAIQLPVVPGWTNKNRLVGSPFTNVNDLMAIAPLCDKAEVVPLYYMMYQEGVPESIVKLNRFFGVKNTTTLDVAAVVRGRYTVMTHGEVINILSVALGQYNQEVFGYVKNYNDVVSIDMCFPRMLVNSRAGPILMGARVVNSYDLSCTFNGYSYCYFGGIPLNVSRLLGQARFSAKHTKGVSTTSTWRVTAFLNKLYEAELSLRDSIHNATIQTVRFDGPEKLFGELVNLFGSKRIARDVVLKYFHGLEGVAISKWDFYIKLSEYVNDTREISERNAMDISARLGSILEPNYAPDVEDEVMG